jgi:hypothetical protein
MIVNRMIFQAKFGKAGDVVERLKDAGSAFDALPGSVRILTDRTGRFDTVVLEIEAESLADHDRMREAMFADTETRQDGSTMLELVESGERQFWTIEKEFSSD